MSSCPYLDPPAFHFVFSLLSSWAGEWQSRLVNTGHPAKVKPPRHKVLLVNYATLSYFLFFLSSSCLTWKGILNLVITIFKPVSKSKLLLPFCLDLSWSFALGQRGEETQWKHIFSHYICMCQNNAHFCSPSLSQPKPALYMHYN